MSIDVKLFHRTAYKYDPRVELGPQVIRLRPSEHCRTPILAYSLKLQPDDHWLNWQQDAYNNHMARVVAPNPTGIFEVIVELVARIEARNPFDYFLESEAEHYPVHYSPAEKEDLAPYFRLASIGPKVQAWIDSIDRQPRETTNFLYDLNAACELSKQRESQALRHKIKQLKKDLELEDLDDEEREGLLRVRSLFPCHLHALFLHSPVSCCQRADKNKGKSRIS